MTKARKAWDELNERQRNYLEVFYGIDQDLEEERYLLGAQGRWNRTPAHIWRRIHLNGADSPAARSLRARNVYDSGAGATLAALRDRGLIETEAEPGLMRFQVFVRLTRAGRAAVRAGKGESA